MRSAIVSLLLEDCLASVDIGDAYLHVPIFPQHQCYLQLLWETMNTSLSPLYLVCVWPFEISTRFLNSCCVVHGQSSVEETVFPVPDSQTSVQILQRFRWILNLRVTAKPIPWDQTFLSLVASQPSTGVRAAPFLKHVRFSGWMTACQAGVQSWIPSWYRGFGHWRKLSSLFIQIFYMGQCDWPFNAVSLYSEDPSLTVKALAHIDHQGVTRSNNAALKDLIDALHSGPVHLQHGRGNWQVDLLGIQVWIGKHTISSMGLSRPFPKIGGIGCGSSGI